MSQNDFNLANQGFPSMRADMNSALQALASNSAGDTEPSTTYAYQWWYDSTADALKIRNADNDAWITFATFDQATDSWSLDINGGTIDGTVIGGSTAAAITGTAGQFDTSLNVDGAATVDSLTVNGNAYPSAGPLSNRNLIINGAMQVAQRGASVTGVTSGGYRTCDRWLFDIGSSDTGAWTVSQETDSPAGFSKSMKVECTTAKADISTDWRFLSLQHRLEGQNVTSTKFGTSSAESLTVSFWVKSNKTGTYTVEMANENAAFRQSQEFSVSSSGTWEKKTITMSGDTAHGFASDNGISLYLIFWLAASPNLSSGSLNTSWSSATSGRASSSNVNLADTVGNYFQITGVQLEVGDTATPFEHRSYGDELARCQRYYFQGTKGSYPEAYHYYAMGNTAIVGNIPFPVTMRATPSVTLNSNGTDNRAVRVNTATTVTFSPVQSWWTASGVAGLYDDVNNPFNSGESYGIGVKADAEL